LREDALVVQRPRPPLIIGGSARRGTTSIAARFAEEYNTHGADPREAGRRRRHLDEACEKAGRDPSTMRFSLMSPFLIGHDHAKRFVEVYPSAGSPDGWFEELRRRRLAGSTVDLVDGLREFEAAGVDRVMLQHVVHRDLDVVAALGEIAAAL
jgi:alkanesulfonate monooxygenase SsuD/methylene tetrahydromethanopterin reductase-like flavin-dependent oxidoreductase (luciferase family)